MKKEKVGITPLDWALSIGGIAILACLIILPPVFRIVFKEEAKPIEDNQPVVEYMTCTKNNFVTDGHMTNDKIEFTYIGSRISKYNKTMEMTFNDVVSYEQTKEIYDKEAAKYSFIKNGATYVVNLNVDDLKITVKEDYNLGIFQNTEVTLPGEDTPSIIRSDYTREDSIKDIKMDLTASGYVCK